MPDLPSYQDRRRAASEVKRRAILKAAGWCFAENGYKRTAVETIATRSQVSKGLVFHLFESKESLFNAVVEDSLSQWSLLSEIRASDMQQGSGDELRSLFATSFEFIEQHPILLLFMRDDSFAQGRYSKRIVKKNSQWRRRIEKTLSEGVRNGSFKTDTDIKRITIIFHELQTALIRRAYDRGKINKPDRKLIDIAINAIVFSLEH